MFPILLHSIGLKPDTYILRNYIPLKHKYMQSPFHRRILKEIKSLSQNTTPNIQLKTHDLTNIRIQIDGAEDTIYQNESFDLLFKLTHNYPIEAPEVIFTDSIPINEHVYSNGHICLSILYDQWSPACTIESVCLSIISMLSSATQKRKPVNDKSYCVISKNKSPKEFKWSYHDQ